MNYKGIKPTAALGAAVLSVALQAVPASADKTATCHTGPGAAFPVATMVPDGHSMSAIDTFQGWTKIEANGKRCWAQVGTPKAKKPSGAKAKSHSVAAPAQPVIISRTVQFYNESIKNPQYSTWQAPVYSAYDTDVGYGYRYPRVTSYPASLPGWLSGE